MGKILRGIFIALMIVFAVAATACAASVTWSAEALEQGTLTATLEGATNGSCAIMAYYDDDTLMGISRSTVSAYSAQMSVYVDSASDNAHASVMVWDDMTPRGAVVSTITKSGIKDNANGMWVSDNQITNNPKSIAYHTFEPLSETYRISFELFVYSNSDNAILIGDSANGSLVYATSSATLLFNNSFFSVRNGNGNGSYDGNAVSLMAEDIWTTYTVAIEGDVAQNIYRVTVTDFEGNTRQSAVVKARTNAAKLDTVALISNGHNTQISESGEYSDYYFDVENFRANNASVEFEEKNEPQLGEAIYTGFAGRYYNIKDVATGKYLRGNNGKITADLASVSPSRTDAAFLPRYMGNKAYALMCLSSSNRITASSVEAGEVLSSSVYNTNNKTQHWKIVKSGDYYRIQHVRSGLYVNIADGKLVSSSEPRDFSFEAVDSISPLVQISRTAGYGALTDAQRKRIESVYESVAGDIFGRYGGHDEYTIRWRFDDTFNKIIDEKMEASEQLSTLESLLNKTNGFVFSGQSNQNAVSKSLPDTEGLYYEKDEGVYSERKDGEGGYYFWSGTYLSGYLYKLKICNSAGETEQTLNLYVHDNDTAKANADAFCKAIVQIPYKYRRFLKNVRVRYDSANSYNGGGNDMYIRLNWKNSVDSSRSTITHELGHIIDSNCGYWARGDGWYNAMDADCYGVSSYGNNNSTEDFAEFCRMYIECYDNLDMQTGIQMLFPERYASFRRLRQTNLKWELWDDEEYIE